MHLTIPFSRRQRIINALLLNASSIDNLGLLNGKMGIAIYFFHLARESKKRIYEDYAGELIDEIYEEITVDTPIEFENGIAGIGWGVEYLVQNGFLEADTNEILEEFDSNLYKKLTYNTPKEMGFSNGLVGLGMYFLKRVQNPKSNDENTQNLHNIQTLNHIFDELEHRLRNGQIAKLTNILPDSLELETTAASQGRREIFNLVSDYNILLWFLSELQEQKIFNYKVEKLIAHIVTTLIIKENFPRLQSNRLILLLVIKKLEQTIKLTETKAILLNLLTDFLNGISRETILAELSANDISLRNGTSGIAWAYLQLWKLTGNDDFFNEANFWHNRSFKLNKDNKLFAGERKTENNSFGLIEGLAEISFMNR